jgi:hypothetical protein
MKGLRFVVLGLPVLLTAGAPAPQGDEIRPTGHRRDAGQPQDTATWKDFSSRAGWSIKYPPTWAGRSCANAPDPRAANVTCVVFGQASGEGGIVRVQQLADRPSWVSAARWLDHVKRTTNGDRIVAEDTVFVAGGRGLRVQYGNAPGRTDMMTYVIIGARAFALMADAADDSIYARMVRTFQVRLL